MVGRRDGGEGTARDGMQDYNAHRRLIYGSSKTSSRGNVRALARMIEAMIA